MMSVLNRSLLALALLLMSCPVLSAPAEQPQEYARFTPEQLTHAIAGELAARRGRTTDAARMYYTLATETGDAAIISRAAEFAIAANDFEAVRELANQWIERDPQASTPHQLLAYEAVERGKLLDAVEHMENVLARGGQGSFTTLSSRSDALDSEQLAQLRRRLQQLRTDYPDNLSLAHAVIQVLDQADEQEQARQLLAETREQFGNSPRLALLDAQLLQNDGEAGEALRVLEEAVTDYPRHRQLRYNYARMLVSNDNVDAAYEQFAELIEQRPNDLQSRYSMALLDLERDAPERARQQLQQLVERGYRVNTARYYLGYAEELVGNAEAALAQYRQVEQGSGAFMIAQQRALQLLINSERFAEASSWRQDKVSIDSDRGAELANLQAQMLVNRRQNRRAAGVLDTALEHHPRNVDLLFSRALVHDRQDDFEAMEQLLQRAIEIDPDNAQALNYLGYSLLEQTERHEEALQLIQRAIDIAPDDPAIRDSLGWAQYKLGRHEDALRNLSRAYNEFPDPEVAAHLGEVLWVTGEQERARQVWNEGLERAPDSAYIRDTMDRLLP